MDYSEINKMLQSFKQRYDSNELKVVFRHDVITDAGDWRRFEISDIKLVSTDDNINLMFATNGKTYSRISGSDFKHINNVLSVYLTDDRYKNFEEKIKKLRRDLLIVVGTLQKTLNNA